MVRAGDLRQRLIIQIASKAKDAGDAWVKTWTTWATVWADIIPDTGNTQYSASQLNSEANGKIRIRWRYGVKPTMRGSYQGHIYEFLSIIEPQKAHDDLVIIYREKLD